MVGTEIVVKRFGEKLRTLRTRHGMNMRTPAHALGYKTYSYIGDVALGKTKPGVDLVMRVARFFHVTADVLLAPRISPPSSLTTPLPESPYYFSW